MSASPKIVNGSDSVKGEQPWIAALLYKGSREASLRQFCSAALIAPAWVLTAAHCIEDIQLSSIEVLVGEEDIENPESQAVNAIEAIVHPLYLSGARPYDVGLIKLERELNNVPLAFKAIDFDVIATVHGFGKTAIVDDPECEVIEVNVATDLGDVDCFTLRRTYSERPSYLQQLQLNLFPLAGCVARYNAYIDEERGESPHLDITEEDMHPKTICAWKEQEQASPCFGDSGGPIVQREGGIVYQVGIVSSGYGDCVHSLGFGLIVTLSQVSDFIDEVMGRDLSIDFDDFCPAPMNLNVDYGLKTASSQWVTLSWDAVENAQSYRVRFANFPVSTQQINEMSLPVETTEATLELQMNDAIALSIQAVNANCDGAMSPTRVIRRQP
ncbi:MAG: serine protease [Pseudohongiellaceae bacterium]|nr:serine protease [Pseudohongiellaceae bacterium]